VAFVVGAPAASVWEIHDASSRAARLRCGQKERIVLSFTLRHSRRRDNEEPVTGAEHPTENDELSRDVLGIIEAYRMAAALDTRISTGRTNPSTRIPEARPPQ
jgi:hypothetical protein